MLYSNNSYGRDIIIYKSIRWSIIFNSFNCDKGYWNKKNTGQKLMIYLGSLQLNIDEFIKM